MTERAQALEALKRVARDIGTVKDVASRRSDPDRDNRRMLARLSAWRSEILRALNILEAVPPRPPVGSPTTKRCDVCGEPAIREFCYAAEPWVPYCGLHCPQYAPVGERQLKSTPVEPAGASEPPSEDEDDDVPLSESQGSVDAWSAPLRKPVVPKILSMDDFYALLRILEVLPADPFLTDLQSKLSDEERRQHGNRASHLSGSEFVREIERVEDLIQSRLQPAPVSPVAPEPPTEMSESERLFKLAAWVRSPGNINPDDAVDECARLLENNARLLQSKPTGAPAPCVWRETRDHGLTVYTPSCRPECVTDTPLVTEYVVCPHCKAPLTVER